MRIGFYSKCLFMNKGGNERITSVLANYFANTGNKVFLYHGEKTQDSPVYELDQRIMTCELPLDVSKIEKTREIFLQNDIDVFCAMSSNNDRLFFLKLLRNTNTPLVFSEHMDPSCAVKFFTTQKCRDFCFQYADALHFLCHDFAHTISEEQQKKAFVIPNSAFWDGVESLSREKDAPYIILTTARLQEFHKRTSFLIKAFRLLHARYPDWKCVICGDGSDRQSYEKMIAAYGLQERIILTGNVSDVQSYYKTASLFCLPSAFEGLPCSMIEAQCYGIPCVGFASCAGVNEIIRHGENGLLADSFTPESLAACLDRLMGDRELRQRMRCRSLELSHRYDKESVLAQWRTLLEHAASKKGHTALDAAPAVAFPTDEKDLKPSAPLIMQQLRTSLKLAREVAMLDNKEARS